MIEELRTKTPLRPSMCVLGSREHLCVNDDIRGRSNRDEACLEAIRPRPEQPGVRRRVHRGCTFYRGYCAASGAERERDDDLADNGEEAILDLEDLAVLMKGRGICPYLKAKDMSTRADVVFLPYNYLIDSSNGDECG